MLATTRELLEEARQARRCACAVAEATDPPPTSDGGGDAVRAAGTGQAAEITTANGCRAE